jgi:hypothetical protein
MINVWIKNGEPSLYGNGEVYLIMKTYINLTNSVDDENEANARSYIFFIKFKRAVFPEKM